ncbi:MAG: SPOR domain-containing protein [Pseudomonadota bacterium]
MGIQSDLSKLGLGMFAAVLIGLTPIAGAVEAQSLRETVAPAETPPASFTGRQYVDSDGCVFVRAGVNGATRWVPRVTRDRQVVCGATPTRVAGATTTVQAAPATQQTVATAASMPRAAPVIAAPRVAPTVISPQRTQQRAPQTVFQPSRQAQARSVGCGGVSQVRCGPQSQSPQYIRRITSGGGFANGLARNGAGGLQEQYMVSPHVTSSSNPQGYQPVWTDGRLNPARGVTVGTSAHLAAPTVIASTKSAPQPVRQSAPASGRYVQVGTFGQASNAQAAARRLQSVGLPARIGAARSYQVVMAGPFASTAQLNAALSAARRAGFSDAFVR